MQSVASLTSMGSDISIGESVGNSSMGSASPFVEAGSKNSNGMPPASPARKPRKHGTTNAYFYWVTREQGSFDWFRGVMKEVEEIDHKVGDRGPCSVRAFNLLLSVSSHLSRLSCCHTGLVLNELNVWPCSK